VGEALNISSLVDEKMGDKTIQRILLTGSSGMIGTRLFERLQEKDYEVIGIDKNHNKWRKDLDAKTIIGNLLEKNSFKRIPKDVDLVIHLAANARVWELIKNPSLAIENIIMTYNVLEFMRKGGIKRIIFSSSREVYGNMDYKEPIKKNIVRVKYCESPYAASKISGESLVHSWGKVYGIDFVILRFSNVYGMYDDSDRVIPLWIKQTLEGQDLVVYGEDKSLDFTYIEDAVSGAVKAVERFDDVKNETFNIAYGKEIKLSYVGKRIKELVGGTNKLVIKNERLGEVRRFAGDISEAKELLDYDPKVDIDKGLRKTVEWYKQLWASDHA